MQSHRPILLVGGAPRVPVDAIRHLTVKATGATAIALSDLLRATGREPHLLLSCDSIAHPAAERYHDRDSLENALGSWIARHPDGCLVLSAAVNDYRVAAVECWEDGECRPLRPGAKIASSADEVVIRLRQAGKLIDRLRPEFGLRGPIIAFKYEDASTVLASATALRTRVGAVCVVANSLCGAVQALIHANGPEIFTARDQLLVALAKEIAAQ